MVDNSNLLISFYSGAKGGTKNTVEYANKVSISIKNIYDKKYN